MSMEDKTKQQIEEEALILINAAPFQLNGLDRFYGYKTVIDRLIQAAEYGYNIKESVNEKLVEALGLAINIIRKGENPKEWEALKLINDVYLSASNQEKLTNKEK